MDNASSLLGEPVGQKLEMAVAERVLAVRKTHKTGHQIWEWLGGQMHSLQQVSNGIALHNPMDLVTTSSSDLITSSVVARASSSEVSHSFIEGGG